MQICNKCGIVLTDANWRKSSQKYYRKRCRLCEDKYLHDWHKSHSENWKKICKRSNDKRVAWKKLYDKERKINRKIEIMSHYCNGEPKCMNPKCAVDGGMKDLRALSIDHINGNGWEQRRELGRRGKCSTFFGGDQLYLWLKRNNYPDGFQVLCMNCQFIKRHENGEHAWQKGRRDKK